MTATQIGTPPVMMAVLRYIHEQPHVTFENIRKQFGFEFSEADLMWAMGELTRAQLLVKSRANGETLIVYTTTRKGDDMLALLEGPKPGLHIGWWLVGGALAAFVISKVLRLI